MKRTVSEGICISVIMLFFTVTGLALAADPALIEAAKKEGEIVWYTAFPRRFVPPICDLFKKAYNLGEDFKVTATRKGSGATQQMVEAEHMAGKSNWDVVSMGDETPSYRWMDQGMLMKYQPPNIGNIREEFQDPYGHRIASLIGISSIGLHKKRAPEKDWPKRYKDALDPKWKGRVALLDPATAGPGVMFTRFMVDLYGWEFFRELGKNKPILAKGGSALEQLLLSGEADLTLCPNEFSILERISRGETDLKVIYPEEGVAFYTMWTCLNKDAPHPNAAKLWAEFVASDERQAFIAKHAGRYITNKNVELGFPRPPLKFHKLDWKWIVANKDDMCKRFIEEIRKGQQES